MIPSLWRSRKEKRKTIDALVRDSLMYNAGDHGCVCIWPLSSKVDFLPLIHVFRIQWRTGSKKRTWHLHPAAHGARNSKIQLFTEKTRSFDSPSDGELKHKYVKQLHQNMDTSMHNPNAETKQ